MATTPYMGLNLPTEGVTPGTDWATDLNTALTQVDQHDHTPGKGTPVPITGVDINATVDVNGQTLSQARDLNFEQQPSTLSGSETDRIYDVNGDLYFNNGSGVAIQITQGNALFPPTVVGIPTGIMFPYGGLSAPSGYLLCDGTAVSRTTYSDLFAVVGTSFGIGDGATTFNLPDLRGRAPIGAGTYTDPVSGGVTRTVGQSLGAEKHVLTTPEMPSHNHGVTDPGHNHTIGVDVIAASGASRQTVNAGGSAGTTYIVNNTTGISINNTGGGTAHNIMQPSLAMNFIIKT